MWICDYLAINAPAGVILSPLEKHFQHQEQSPLPVGDSADILSQYKCFMSNTGTSLVPV